MFSDFAQTTMADPQYYGPPENPEQMFYGIAGAPGDGPYMELWLEVSDGKIVRAQFRTFGCPSARACGSMVCRLLNGVTLDRAALLTAADLVRLGDIPEGKEYCADLAERAIQNITEVVV